jgi:hypothetical protein
MAVLEQHVRDQMLIREVNDRIADIFAETEDFFVGEDSFTEFLCECSNAHCTATLPISLLEYKGIRSSPRLFVVLPGHESPEVERVAESHATFSLVEKAKNVGLVLNGQRDSLPPKGGSS